MDELVDDMLYIINNYRDYLCGKDYLENLNKSFNNIQLKLKCILNEYEIEFNNIQGKPNKPFIPLLAIRNKIYSKNMTEGVYVAILIKQDKGIYISLNQGTENKSKESIEHIRDIYKEKVNNLIISNKIDNNSRLLDEINLCDNLIGNTKRARSYEYGNIKAIFYDKITLKNAKEMFLRDLLWTMELYRISLR
ncbi:Domain of uncharacterised function (DUF3578) [uncultured Clostridium sp.]|nr:Domain of uncharacterised function (DUF3578) [uncultured Clostridium sp.]SCI99600.1 Domain of uncharacterised function (DUF3578) [uncultured Clostridium sp.]